jgi:hypothetical protein
MPNVKPAIQWGIALFMLYYVVHDPATATDMVGSILKFVSDFFHSIGNIVSFHSNVSS